VLAEQKQDTEKERKQFKKQKQDKKKKESKITQKMLDKDKQVLKKKMKAKNGKRQTGQQPENKSGVVYALSTESKL